jgi:glutaredoxin-related protein
MILYSSSTCPRCKVLKLKLTKAELDYTIEDNMEKMQALGIKSLPYLQLDDGTLLDFNGAIAYVREVEAQKK